LENLNAFWTKYIITDNKINSIPDNNVNMTANKKIKC